MALTGQLSDMSLAELIEFFCNQRKTGRLKVDYHRGHGVFFIKEGELVDAKVGQLSGPEAVYFALTLPNAAFDFSPEVLPSRRTIETAWTQVVLEGLRRLDEGISPTESDAFGGWTPTEADMALFMDQVERMNENARVETQKAARQGAADADEERAAPLSMMVDGAGAGGSKKKWMALGAVACVALVAAVVAIPVLRGSGKSSAQSNPAATAEASEAAAQAPSAGGEAAGAGDSTDGVSTDWPPADAAASDAAADTARREREERERRLREQRERKAEELAKKADANQNTSATATQPAPAATGPKSVRVSVTYDEAGRVTAASVAGTTPGAEAYAGTAVRVARGRRFPAGKPGSTVITIPFN